MPRASIVVTGDEVLLGRIDDDNAGPLARAIAEHGLEVTRTVFVGDDEGRIAAEVRQALEHGLDLLVVTGGLGPTADDVTMKAVAAGAGVGLERSEAARRTVAERTAWVTLEDDVRRRLLDAQALIPAGATLIPAAGTAPGVVLPARRTLIVVLPGPPWERALMWEWSAGREPLAGVLARGSISARRVLRIFDVSESLFVQELERIGAPARAARAGVRAHDGELEVTIEGPSEALAELTERLRAAFGERVYSVDGRSLDEIIQDALRGASQTLAIAESCTGGGLGARVTATPGASDVFLGGIIAYANAAKEGSLGVPRTVLERHGAVSGEVAALMADGARATFGADWGLSITGVAGPGGGTADKPVGLVLIGCAGPRGAEVVEHRFRGDRPRIRERAAAMALHMLRQALEAARAQAGER